MKYKYTLNNNWIKKILTMEEFRNGASQVTIRLKNNIIYEQVLISNSKHIIAIKGYNDLPFNLDDIDEIYQRDLDKKPEETGGWVYWDKW